MSLPVNTHKKDMNIRNKEQKTGYVPQKEFKKELIRELKASIDNVNEELEQCEEPEKRAMLIKMKRNLELTLQENLDRQQLFWVIPCSSFGAVESAFKTGSYTVKKVSQLDKAAVGKE